MRHVIQYRQGPDNCLINVIFANTKFKSKVILDILNCFQAYIYDTFISVENKIEECEVYIRYQISPPRHGEL